MSPEPACTSEPPPEPRLLDQMRGRLRVKHYSIRTEQAYVDWVRRFILFHGKRHPRDLGPQEVEAFLTHLAAQARVSASAHNQAKSAILFLFWDVIPGARAGTARRGPGCRFRVGVLALRTGSQVSERQQGRASRRG